MSRGKKDIWVHAHWSGMTTPKCIGILSAHQAKGKKAFSFEYEPTWIRSEEQLLLDPDIGWYSGPQFPVNKGNFGIFLNSMPDRWGRTLMKRRAVQDAKEKGEPAPTLYDIDFLLGVQDETRMGALRFQNDPDGPFVNNDTSFPVPPMTSVRELQYAAGVIESDEDMEEARKWLNILLAPGSSLGGARPKANVYDQFKNLWIVKFPSKSDERNVGAWEFLANRLAYQAGITVSDAKLDRVIGKYDTFFTKRFDRNQQERIHFASAMTMTGRTEDSLKDEPGSYLDLAEFIQFSGATPTADLHQLWRRIVFNIAISNTDDHLRNHGFLLTPEGWRLSPAYDLNPTVGKNGLSLNIDMDDNSLDYDLAMSVGEYFQLDTKQMTLILKEIESVVKSWRALADELKISRQEQELMEPAFRH